MPGRQCCLMAPVIAAMRAAQMTSTFSRDAEAAVLESSDLLRAKNDFICAECERAWRRFCLFYDGELLTDFDARPFQRK